jgi:hypothetical protein
VSVLPIFYKPERREPPIFLEERIFTTKYHSWLSYSSQIMANLEFIEEWNNIIPYKIKETELLKPNEKFLFKAIMAIMKLMHMETNHLDNVRYLSSKPYYESHGLPLQLFNEKPDVARKQKIKFVRTINQLYKVGSDSKHTFCHIDFVSPCEYSIAPLCDL